MLKIFFLSYFQLLLLTFHSRCLNTRNYLGMALTNVIVSILYCTMFKTLMQSIDDPLTIVAYTAGSTLGGVTGVWLHHRFLKKE